MSLAAGTIEVMFRPAGTTTKNPNFKGTVYFNYQGTRFGPVWVFHDDMQLRPQLRWRGCMDDKKRLMEFTEEERAYYEVHIFKAILDASLAVKTESVGIAAQKSCRKVPFGEFTDTDWRIYEQAKAQKKEFFDLLAEYKQLVEELPSPGDRLTGLDTQLKVEAAHAEFYQQIQLKYPEHTPPCCLQPGCQPKQCDMVAKYAFDLIFSQVLKFKRTESGFWRLGSTS